MKEKINQILISVKTTLTPKIKMVDEKISTFIPNPKLKKTVYIAIGSLFGFMFLIIILGLMFSPLKNQQQTTGTVLNKPSIVATSPEPKKTLSETQQKILNLETQIKELKFPESKLNLPVIQSEIKI